MSNHTCTITVAATGERCGKAAVVSFVGSDGQHYAECADHVAFHPAESVKEGETLTVRRHGKEYVGIVDRITAGGKVFARVTYGNGRERVVEV